MLVAVLLAAGLPILSAGGVFGAEAKTPSSASLPSSLLPAALASPDRVPRPQLIEAGLGEHCVEPIPVIRRRHPQFLEHQRDRTVHEGIRGERHSLAGCIDCHAARDAQGQWIRIDAPGQFCESCHSYVAVEPDCFGCHSALPEVAFEEGGDEGRERASGVGGG
ncbi:MAG: sulfur reduction protein DsrJ [Ectothiorhodospiraceae bacterium AqS1]|nr:sulfur reduction protein DsrJ [Ectothiorhodospiraceae bacterium AqS1]